jgi:glycosyltransferase involved in cell wall biosynthesis
MKFSFIVPAYNSEAVLERSVNSVLNQSCKDVEVIVVDDGSKDGTSQVCRSFSDPRVVCEKLERNSGVHVARNRGIDLARGDYLVFLDSDDELMTGALEIFNKYIKSYPNTGMFSAPYSCNGLLTGLDLSESGYVAYEDLLCTRYAKRNKVGLGVIRSDVAKKHRFVEQNLDFIYFRRVMKEAPVFYIAEPVALYHLADNAGALHVTRKKPNEALSMRRAKELDIFLKEFRSDYLRYCPKIYGNYAYGAAVGLLLSGEKKQAVLRSFESLRYGGVTLRFLAFFILTLLPFSSLILKSLFRVKRSIYAR